MDTNIEQYAETTPGNSVKIRTKDGDSYEGTVMKKVGATLYVQSNDMRQLEIRRVNANDGTVLLLAIGGKYIEETESKEGYNKNGHKVKQETTKLQFDKQITEFYSKDSDLTL